MSPMLLKRIPLPILPAGNETNKLASPPGVIWPIVPCFPKLTAYIVPDVLTAGPSTPLGKLFKGVKVDDLKSSLLEF